MASRAMVPGWRAASAFGVEGSLLPISTSCFQALVICTARGTRRWRKIRKKGTSTDMGSMP